MRAIKTPLSPLPQRGLMNSLLLLSWEAVIDWQGSCLKTVPWGSISLPGAGPCLRRGRLPFAYGHFRKGAEPSLNTLLPDDACIAVDRSISRKPFHKTHSR